MKSELNALLQEIERIYDRSAIKKSQQGKGSDWSYSLINSSLKRNGPLILGFNWGAAAGESYFAQSDIVKTNFETADVGSLSRIFGYCRKYFGDDFLASVSQSNYCFFRSQKEAQILEADLKLCEPLFDRMIELVEPVSIICLSSRLRDYLIRNDRVHSLKTHPIKFTRGKSTITFNAMKGVLLSGVKIRFLPHPNYPMAGEARDAAWEFCCGAR